MRYILTDWEDPDKVWEVLWGKITSIGLNMVV